jgi:hypothetical protein
LKQAGISRELLTLQAVEESLTAAWSHYKILKKQATYLRSTWVEEVAAAKAEAGNTSAAQELKNLLSREKQRRNARIIKYVIANQERRGLSSIEVLNNGVWVELTEQKEIEEALLKELQARFNQAKETPFAMEPLLSAVGALGFGPASGQILRGNFTPTQEIDPWAVKLIPFLQQEIQQAPIEKLSKEEYAEGWRKVKERTSSGPSGVTIPHMKAHGQVPYLAEADALMAHLPYLHGFSPERWKKGLDIMLEKKPGVRHINTLRAILLYEADFNQNNKRLGREMLY